MALTVSMTMRPPRIPESEDEILPDPVVYPNAYARILTVRVMKDLTFITVIWHADQAARENNAEPVLMEDFYLDTADLAGDVYPAAYAHLKTLAKFAGAVDC